MANYIPIARSNYFKVKDVAAFKARFNGMQGMEVTMSDDDTMVGLLCTEGEGAWPSDLFNDRTEEYESYDFIEDLRSHLVPGEVVVLMEVGYEKMRYVVGVAQAFTDTGEVIVVTLDDIYNMAKEKFGKFPTLAQY